MASGGEKKRRNLRKDEDEDMVAALEAVKSNALTVTQAATTYNVPRKTLDDRVKGRVVHGMNPGRDTVLSPREEKALCNYLVYMAERGFPLTCSIVSRVELLSSPNQKLVALHTFLCSHLLLVIEVIRSVLSLHFLVLNSSCTMSD